MLFEPSANEKDIPLFVDRFVALVGWRNIQRRVESINAYSEREPAAGEHLASLSTIEREIVSLKQKKRQSGGFAKQLFAPHNYPALAFAVMTVKVHSRLSEVGKRRLVGRLRGAMNQRHGLDPIVHEITVATHLMSVGWAVSFADLEKQHRFDFLASKQGVNLEIECKSVSSDLGRKIHRWDFRRLSDLCNSYMLEAASEVEHTGLLVLEVSDRLPSQESALKTIAEAVITVARGESESYHSEAFRVTKEILSIPGVTIQDDKQIRAVLEKRFPKRDYHAFFAGRGYGAYILVAQSQRRDQVLTYIYKQIKKGHEQFSGERGAAMWVNVQEIDHEHWESLRSGSGLQLMSSRYLAGTPRQNVCLLAYSSGGRVHKLGSVTSQSGAVLHYDNPRSPSYHELFRSIFG